MGTLIRLMASLFNLYFVISVLKLVTQFFNELSLANRAGFNGLWTISKSLIALV